METTVGDTMEQSRIRHAVSLPKLALTLGAVGLCVAGIIFVHGSLHAELVEDKDKTVTDANATAIALRLDSAIVRRRDGKAQVFAIMVVTSKEGARSYKGIEVDAASDAVTVRGGTTAEEAFDGVTKMHVTAAETGRPLTGSTLAGSGPIQASSIVIDGDAASM